MVEHRCDRIDAKTVDVHFLNPEKGICEQEILDLGSAVVEDLGAPFRVLTLTGIRVS
jgi:hypothetical protein